MPDDPLATALLDGFVTSFRSQKKLVERAIAQIGDDALRRSLDANTNSIAVIMKHVAGNLRSRFTDFLTTDGEKPWRERDQEFIDNYPSRAALLEDWESGWAVLFATLSALGPADLLQTVTVRGEPHSVPTALARSLAHCGYHAGQVVQIARIFAGDEWKTLSIARGASDEFNRTTWGPASPPPR
jgi:hypothetical protein